MITINNKMDEMFGAMGDVSVNAVTNIPVNKIYLREDHPFYINEDKLSELKDSIKEHGILTPLVVREIDGNYGHYELLAGHHRLKVCTQLNITIVPCIIKAVDDDTAKLIMIETNKQRGFTDMKHSEKAFALKMEIDILKKQGKRTDLDNTADSKNAKDTDLSPTTIKRYIRLTYLTPNLLEMVDEGKIKVRPAVSVSFIDTAMQKEISDCIEMNNYKLDMKKADLLKECFYSKTINADIIEKILAGEKTAKEETETKNITIAVEDIQQYVTDRDMEVSEYKEYILTALEFYKNNSLENDNSLDTDF